MESLPKSFCVLTENDEISGALVDVKTRQIFEKFEKYIELVHISDQQSFSKAEFALKCDFFMPSDLGELKDFDKLV
jgi:hypothetical protein